MSLSSIITNTEPVQLVSIGLSVVILATVLFYVSKKKIWGKTIILIILCILLLRILMFNNPFAWSAYRKFLSLSDLGFRNNDIVSYKKKSFQKKLKTKYLVVGNSQAQAVFGKFSYLDPQHRLSLFSLAGLSPLEYYLFADEIISRDPNTIILHLSEFDLGRGPKLSQVENTVAKGFNIFRLYKLLDSGLQSRQNFQRQYNAAVIGTIIPEHKYAFIYRALIEKAMGRNQALGTLDVGKISDAEYMKQHLKLLKKLSDDYIDFHIGFIREFIELCLKKNINIVIVEGQYHPLAYSKKNRELNLKVKKALLSLINPAGLVKFISREDIRLLQADDFRDGYHVKPDTGLQYASQLINYLEETHVLRTER